MENVTGNIDINGNFDDAQTWHSFEVHIKLASSDEAGDGILEIWLDGVKQGALDEQQIEHYPTNASPTNFFPTDTLGVGINYITIMDNASYFDWSEQHYIYIDDVTISTSYIGENAVAAITGTATDGVYRIRDYSRVGNNYNNIDQ